MTVPATIHFAFNTGNGKLNDMLLTIIIQVILAQATAVHKTFEAVNFSIL